MVLEWADQTTFLVLTVIVIVAIMLLTEKMSDALTYIGLISQFLIISTLMASIHEKGAKDRGPEPDFVEIPPATMYVPFHQGFAGPDAELREPSGAAEFPPAERSTLYAAGLGPEDLEAMHFASPPPHGGEPEHDRAAPTFDGDRMVVEHARWRHDPYRVADGTRQRKALIQRFAGEEIEAEENTPWWGRWDV